MDNTPQVSENGHNSQERPSPGGSTSKLKFALFTLCLIGFLFQIQFEIEKFTSYQNVVETSIQISDSFIPQNIAVCYDLSAYYRQNNWTVAQIAYNTPSIRYFVSNFKYHYPIEGVARFVYQTRQLVWLSGEYKCFILFIGSRNVTKLIDSRPTFIEFTLNASLAAYKSLAIANFDHVIQPFDGNRQFYCVSKKLWRQMTIQYQTTIVNRLPFPYKSNCMVYDRNAPRAALIQDCLVNKSLATYNALPLDVIFSDIDSLRRFLVKLDWQHDTRSECFDTYPRPDCSSTHMEMMEKSAHRARRSSLTHLTHFKILAPKLPTIGTTEHPQHDLSQLLVGIGSLFGLWTGYNMLDISKVIVVTLFKMKQMYERPSTKTEPRHRVWYMMVYTGCAIFCLTQIVDLSIAYLESPFIDTVTIEIPDRVSLPMVTICRKHQKSSFVTDWSLLLNQSIIDYEKDFKRVYYRYKDYQNGNDVPVEISYTYNAMCYTYFDMRHERMKFEVKSLNHLNNMYWAEWGMSERFANGDISFTIHDKTNPSSFEGHSGSYYIKPAVREPAIRWYIFTYTKTSTRKLTDHRMSTCINYGQSSKYEQIQKCMVRESISRTGHLSNRLTLTQIHHKHDLFNNASLHFQLADYCRVLYRKQDCYSETYEVMLNQRHTWNSNDIWFNLVAPQGLETRVEQRLRLTIVEFICGVAGFISFALNLSAFSTLVELMSNFSSYRSKQSVTNVMSHSQTKQLLRSQAQNTLTIVTNSQWPVSRADSSIYDTGATVSVRLPSEMPKIVNN